MKKSKLSDASSFEDAICECARQLSVSGSVILIPTETVYGFACKWDDSAARDKIFQMKKRIREKPFQMLASSVEQAESLGLEITGPAAKLAKKFCPGPITIIVPEKGGGTVGFRIPDSKFVIKLLEKCGFPLAATSANISGEAPALTVEEALKNLDIFPDIVVDGGRIEEGVASTVVDAGCTPFNILRQGPISEDEIRKAL